MIRVIIRFRCRNVAVKLDIIVGDVVHGGGKSLLQERDDEVREFMRGAAEGGVIVGRVPPRGVGAVGK